MRKSNRNKPTIEGAFEEGQQLQQRLEQGKEVTNKELKQLVKEYEKEERKKGEGT